MKTSFLIVVPTLDSYLLLDRLLSSLQNQKWQDWRLLFVDGPSSPKHRLWLSQCCSREPRCRWISQHPSHPGIFGAMNQGFSEVAPHEWLLFWGSDDWAALPSVLSDVVDSLERSASQGNTPDLLVCRGRYSVASTGMLSRFTYFHPAGLLDTHSYRRALWLGSTPPHQATFFGPGARAYLASYASGFRLSADLDYFLKLSTKPGLLVQCLDLELVFMDDAGVSGRQTIRRLFEVARAYRRAFGLWWLFSFFARYIRRLMCLFRQ